MNIKLGSMSFEVSRHVEIKGYAYRQVELKNYIGRFNNRIGSDTFASDDAEISALHNLLCEEANVTPDNHQAFNIGGLWFRFDDNLVNISTDANIGFIGQY